MQQLQVEFLRDEFHRQVRAGQRAGGAVTQLARVGFGVGNKVGPVFQWRVSRHHHAECIAGDIQHIGDVLDGVPVDFGCVRQPEHAQRYLRNRVSIGRRTLQLLRRQRAAGTGLVFNDDRLAENFRRVVGQLTHRDVGRPACRKPNDQLDRSRRKRSGLCLRKGAQRGE